MTILNTKTPNWDITFDCPALGDLSEDQLKIAKILFSLTGDALFVFTMLPNQGVQDSLAFHYQFVASQLAQDIQGAVMNALQQQLWVTPLKGIFSYESLFGTDLLADLKSLVLENGEEDIIEDTFPGDIVTGPSTPEVGNFLFDEFFGKPDEDEEEDNSLGDEEEDEGEEDDSTY